VAPIESHTLRDIRLFIFSPFLLASRRLALQVQASGSCYSIPAPFDYGLAFPFDQALGKRERLGLRSEVVNQTPSLPTRW
jgi:hypothetical protein